MLHQSQPRQALVDDRHGLASFSACRGEHVKKGVGGRHESLFLGHGGSVLHLSFVGLLPCVRLFPLADSGFWNLTISIRLIVGPLQKDYPTDRSSR